MKVGRPEGVRKILLKGIFWRILIIEGILLVWSLLYRILMEPAAQPVELFWYAVRIVILIAIIIVFIMVTFRLFLTRKVILPLEAISESNRKFQEEDTARNGIPLAEDTPQEIQEIVATRTQMLDTILRVSEERLRLVNFIKETFGRYMSKKVVDEILDSPDGAKIGGRRETVTILMSDLRGFTSLSETTDPEMLMRVLNRYLDRMSRIINHYDGIIDEIIGDAILAVFGVPESRPTDPERAVACALAMQNALMELNRDIGEEGYPPLEMGIGINTGTVLVGNIGSEIRMKYGIVGAAVNTAGRIESNTIGGQVLIGESTFTRLGEKLTAEPPQTFMMKGMRKPLVVYAVTGIGDPYRITLETSRVDHDGVLLTLPFRCWRIEDKKVADEAATGETILINDTLLTATVAPPLDPHVDVKIAFDFCQEAHCFEAIYAKVLSIGEARDHGAVHQLGITSIRPEDRDMLKKWMDKAG
ncbi:Adenylate cyclase (EC [Olavius algarvensis associated proteobacterium Delta 3]|nr:Adenylate cyclase (EC [Olavius algarvensis associated proteobacterium Delta 3]CAB5103092.1 Adenylate cyclase (EC [Olavius algarvensis associated proteobacterium Delta 3]